MTPLASPPLRYVPTRYTYIISLSWTVFFFLLASISVFIRPREVIPTGFGLEALRGPPSLAYVLAEDLPKNSGFYPN